MWAKWYITGYLIGIAWGAVMVAYLIARDFLPETIVFLCVVGTALGLAIVGFLAAWAERESK